MKGWQFYLGESPSPGEDPTLPIRTIARLNNARNRTISVAMGRAGSGSFQYNPLLKHAPYFFLGNRYCVVAEYDGVELWSGFIANQTGNASSSTSGDMTVNLLGWLELLIQREIREDVTYGATNPSTGLPWKDWEIVFDLLGRVIAYDPGHAPPVREGAHFGTAMSRQKSWQKGTKLDQCFRELMEVEAGIDIRVDPATRLLNVYAWDYYQDHANLVFGFNKPPNNVEAFGWQVDYMNIRNRYIAVGQGGLASPPVEDTDSQDQYGVFEETANLVDVNEVPILTAFANAEIVMRSQPNIFYNFTPKTTVGSMPKLFRDFQVGDKLRLSVDYGPIVEQEVDIRMFGATLAIADNGSEKLASIQTLANS